MRCELNEFQPARVLFLTGYDWFEPFRDHLGQFSQEVTLHEQLCQYAAKLNYGSGISDVVVCRHPRGKPEIRMTEEAVFQFKRLCDDIDVACGLDQLVHKRNARLEFALDCLVVAAELDTQLSCFGVPYDTNESDRLSQEISDRVQMWMKRKLSGSPAESDPPQLPSF